VPESVREEPNRRLRYRSSTLPISRVAPRPSP
jgi:hypothetical protein